MQHSPQVDAPRQSKRELGQFLTPVPIAELMASMFSVARSKWRVLDAGAGAGALSVALINRLCNLENPPDSIHVTAYELDATLIPGLRKEFESLQKACDASGVILSTDIINSDFVESAAECVRRELFTRQDHKFNAVIMNPPYRKINSNSHTRQMLRTAGIETSNLYTGFLALASKLLTASGEMVAITPRSFCNGPYFRPFRKMFLDSMSLRHIHLFESRSAAFSEDAVLQENVIFRAIKSLEKPRSVVLSTSSGKPNSRITSRKCAYSEVVAPADPESFIHLVTDSSGIRIREQLSQLTESLPDLRLAVSTGRVVDFRATPFLRTQANEDTVPLIRPCHVNSGRVRWPAPRERKACAILDVEPIQGLLVPEGFYVLVKRFTAKEERRRIVACVLDPRQVPYARIGIENHLNFYHSNGRGFERELANGLACFLNSSAVDSYFRHFSGHTQVNATDLRSLKYPSRAVLISLGAKTCGSSLSQSELDNLVHAEVF